MDTYESAERPWGSWKVVHQTPEDRFLTVKVLTINPGCMLSLQSHNQRNEYWLALKDGLMAYVVSGDPYRQDRTGVLLSTETVFEVSRNSKHRLINPTAETISLVEIIRGKYEESDITRYHDTYGRD